jgi:hypothetical protein
MLTNYLSPLKETYIVIIITTDLMRVDIGENYDNSTVMRSLKYSTEFDTVWDDQNLTNIRIISGGNI